MTNYAMDKTIHKKISNQDMLYTATEMTHHAMDKTIHKKISNQDVLYTG